ATLIDEVREIDLAGNTVRAITIDALNQKMASSSLRDAAGNPYQVKAFITMSCRSPMATGCCCFVTTSSTRTSAVPRATLTFLETYWSMSMKKGIQIGRGTPSITSTSIAVP